MFFITAEDVAMLILLFIAIAGFLCYITARFMRWVGAAEHVVLPTIIGAGLSFLVMFIGIRTDWYYATHSSFIIALIGSVGANLLISHVIAPKLDDAVGGALEKASENAEIRAVEKALYSSEREERLETVSSRFAMSHMYKYTVSADAEDVFESVLYKLQSSDFFESYPDIDIEPSFAGESMLIALPIPRGSIEICVSELKSDARKGAEIRFYLCDGFDGSGLDFKVAEIALIRRSIATLMDDLRIIVVSTFHELESSIYSASIEVIARSVER